MAKAIGIDLGTTNSVSCRAENNAARILMNPHNEELTPSIVCCEKLDEDDDEGQITIGRTALNQARLFPADTIHSVKRIIGRTFSDPNVEQLRSMVRYEIIESQEPVKGLAAIRMGGQDYLPEDISAMVLRDIKKYSEKALGDQVTHAVITVPAYFGEPEKMATREAGRKAGLIVKRLVPEPTAAALAFGAEVDTKDGTFLLVFDLGGGTFDISIISIVEQDYHVMEVHGDHFLGGDDFDEEIVKLILAHVQEKYGEDLSENAKFRIVAKAEAEKAKKALSAAESASILVPEAARVGDKEINLRMKISRNDFEDAIRPYVDRCKKLVKETLTRQNMSPGDIDSVLLVGGSTAVPLVHESMEKMFGTEKVRRDVNPMHCVAIGAGILAERMKGIQCPNPECGETCDESLAQCPKCETSLSLASSVVEGLDISDITTNHFGIQAVKDSDANAFKVLVPKGTEIPMRESTRATLYTTEEHQELIKVPVYEGMGESVLQNSKIGQIEYNLPDGLPLNHPVHITLQLDRSMISEFSIQVENYGWSHEESLKRDLTPDEPDEPESWFDDDEEPDDEERMLAILDSYIQRAQKFRADYDGILTGQQKSRLDKAITRGQAILEADDGKNAERRVMDFHQLLNSCGTASLIDDAYVVAHSTDGETAHELTRTADDMRKAAEANDTAMVHKLSAPLASLIRQVHKKDQEIDRIGAADKFDGLLRENPT